MTTLFVGNLPFSATWQDVKDYVSEVADVLHVEIPENYQGKSRGFALVEMATEDDCRDVIGISSPIL